MEVSARSGALGGNVISTRRHSLNMEGLADIANELYDGDCQAPSSSFRRRVDIRDLCVRVVRLMLTAVNRKNVTHRGISTPLASEMRSGTSKRAG